MGESVGLGAGGGALVGALTALLEDRPDSAKVIRNALLGGAAGGVMGAGAKAWKGGQSPDVSPGAVPGNPREMNLALSALSGVLPGVGPAIHGGVSQGVGQGLASGAASIAGPLAVLAPAIMKARASGGKISNKTRGLASVASILGATGAAYAGNRLREKEAAEIVRKTKMVEEHHDHCPHCDHEFHEKGYPRPVNLPEDSVKRDEVLRSGDYDEQCPSCKGIVDPKEQTDDEIETMYSTGFFSQDKELSAQLKQEAIARRETQRRRKQGRIKSASVVVTSCGQRGRLLQGQEALHALLRMPGFIPSPRYAALRDAAAHVALKKSAAKSPSKSEIKAALTAAKIPRDVSIFHAGDRGTACFGDWHEKEVWGATNKVGRKLFNNWEDPDDSEIGRPAWATGAVSSETADADIPHECRHNVCPKCASVTNYCEDYTDGKHEPKKITKEVCKACSNGVTTPESAAKCPGCQRDFEAGEPYPNVDMCEVCERYGPPKSASLRRAAIWGGMTKQAVAPGMIKDANRVTKELFSRLTAATRPYTWKGQNYVSRHSIMPVIPSTLNHVDGGTVRLTTMVTPEAISMQSASLPERFVGKGLGLKMYGRTIREAYESMLQGGPKKFTSDASGSTQDAASHVWQALQRRGYPVTESTLTTGPKFTVDLEQLRGFYKDLPKQAALRPDRFRRQAIRRGKCVDCDKVLGVELVNRGEVACVGCDSDAHSVEKSASAWCPCAKAATHDIYTCMCYGNPMIKSRGWLEPEKSAKEAPGLRQARNATATDPTPAQAAAGNYRCGEFSFKGIPIKIENPKGTERRGYNKLGAITWRRMMHADYGYFTGTKAVDGDAIDVFVGPDHDSDLIVAIDQYRGKEFDETKFVVGVTTLEQGEKLYLKHYPRGWTLGPTSTTTVPQFKVWLKSGAHTKPFKGQMVKAAGVVDSFGDWMRGDGEGVDWRWGLLGPALAGTPVSLGNKLYASTVVPTYGKPRGQKDHSLLRQLTQQAQSEGLKVRNSSSVSSSFNPLTNTITLSNKGGGPGTLAHELGHARGGSGLVAANLIGKKGIGLLPSLGLLSRDENVGHATALAGTALGGGLLASEIDASRRGYQAIRGLGGSRITALKAGIGLPTYAAFSAIPLIAHHLKERLGGYDKSAAIAAPSVTNTTPFLLPGGPVDSAPVSPTGGAAALGVRAARRLRRPTAAPSKVTKLKLSAQDLRDVHVRVPSGTAGARG